MKAQIIVIVAIALLLCSSVVAQDVIVSKGITLTSTTENKTPVLKEVITDLKVSPITLTTVIPTKGEITLTDKDKVYSIAPVSQAITSKDVVARAAYKAEYAAKYAGVGGQHTVKYEGKTVVINIEKVSYDAGTSTVKLNMTASVDGVEKLIHNPYRIYNPPVLVQVTPDILFKNGSVETRGNYVEDPESALLESVAGNAFNQPDGKATYDGIDPTLVVYATDSITEDTGETISKVDFDAPFGTYLDLIVGPGDVASGGTAAVEVSSYGSDFPANVSTRHFMSFNTTPLQYAVSLDNASITVMGTVKRDQLSITPALSFTKFTSANTTNYTAGDYNTNGTGSTRYTVDIQYADFLDGDDPNTRYFTATGLSQINKTGYTQITGRLDNDVDSVNVEMVPPAIADETNSSAFYYRGSNQSGTALDPYISITYTNPPAPTAAFSSNVTQVAAGGWIQFNDTSTGVPTSWGWVFGDGNTSTSQNPTNRYMTVGNYTVNFTATNAYGSGYTNATNYIRVWGVGWFPGMVAPVASYTSNASYGKTNKNKQVLFTDTSTNVPNVWSWTVVNNTGGTTFATSTSQNPTIQFTQTGNFTVILNASNAVGFSNYSTYMQVYDLGQPAAEFYGQPTSGTPGVLVSFVDQSLKGTSSGLVYNWSFGDGAYSLTPYSAIQGNVQHVYAYAGVYDVSLNVTNANGTSIMSRLQYITVSTAQDSVLEDFKPQSIQFSVVDNKNNRVVNAPVNASVVASSFPTGTDWLVDLYKADADAANEMLNGTLFMQGSTDNTGSIVFTMQPSLEYNISILVPSTGITQNRLLYPIERQYTIHLTGTVPNNSYVDVGTNASCFITEPNASYVTFEIQYSDASARTSLVEYYLVDKNNETPLLINYQSTVPVGDALVRLNYTLPNVRANRYSWFYNAVRVI